MTPARTSINVPLHPYGCLRMTRGQRGLPDLHCRTLSFPASWWLKLVTLLMSRPPLLCEEGNVLSHHCAVVAAGRRVLNEIIDRYWRARVLHGQRLFFLSSFAADT